MVSPCRPRMMAPRTTAVQALRGCSTGMLPPAQARIRRYRYSLLPKPPTSRMAPTDCSARLSTDSTWAPSSSSTGTGTDTGTDTGAGTSREAALYARLPVLHHLELGAVVHGVEGGETANVGGDKVLEAAVEVDGAAQRAGAHGHLAQLQRLQR